jgi:peptide/nickel transport system permease protein
VLSFVIRRVLIMIPTLLVISIISFIIIELPPGDFASATIAQQQALTGEFDTEAIQALRARYGLDQPIPVRYFRWITNFVRGDFGHSMFWGAPVTRVVGDRLSLTVVVSFTSLVFAWAIAIPVGLYSAVKQYSIGDYVFTFLGFIGLAIPNFMLALVLMYVNSQFFGGSVGGLFSNEFVNAPWSFAKVLDLLGHLWLPVIVVGTAGTAGTIRIMRNNMLDELNKPYVITARAKGLKEMRILLKYPFRMAVNPVVSTAGWLLPQLIGGAVIVSVVLDLPTTGPVFLEALRQQDMYVAGFFVMALATLTVIGTLLSDLLLAVIDPRIRYR